MSEIVIGARVGRMDVSTAARSAGFPGTNSKATVVRYALARIAGYSDEDARAKAYRQPLNTEPGMIVKNRNITAQIDAELLRQAEAAKPEGITDRATLIRYALFIAANYTPEEALHEARRKIGRPKKELAS